MKKPLLVIFRLILVLVFSISYAATDNQFGLSPRLWVLVPGINTWGENMLNNAKQMLRYDPECVVIIQEAEGWTPAEIKELVGEATKIAIERNKDVIVLIDMELTHNVIGVKDLDALLGVENVGVIERGGIKLGTSYLTPKPLAHLPIVGTRWFDAADWAGQTINLVSASYSGAGGKGQTVVDCHSAGCEGFESSLRFAPIDKGKKIRMFDEIFLSNGRTKTSEIGPLLQESGYTPKEVKLLLNRGDAPALPQIFNLVSGSISNLNAVKRYAGKWWTVYYAKEMSGRRMDHNVLVDKLRVPGTFEVFTGKTSYGVTATVEELKLGVEPQQQDIGTQYKKDDKYFKHDEYFPKPPNPPDKFGGAGIPSLGGVVFDKDNTYNVDRTGKVTKLATSILQARPKKEATSWEFKHKGKTYKAIGIPLKKTKEGFSPQGKFYWDDKEKVIVFVQGDRVIALNCVQSGSYLHILQIAKGKRTEGSSVSDKGISFIVNQVILTDYGLK